MSFVAIVFVGFFYEPCSVKNRHNTSAKSIGPGPPAQSAQVDLCLHFLLLANFPYVQRQVYVITRSFVKKHVGYVF